jgi:hypothetical protein
MPATALAPSTGPKDEMRLRAAVRVFAKADQPARVLAPVAVFLEGYFAPRIGRTPSTVELEVVSELLGSPCVDGKLADVLGEFYQSFWAGA